MEHDELAVDKIDGLVLATTAKTYTLISVEMGVRFLSGADEAWIYRSDTLTIPWPKGMTAEEALLAWKATP